MTNSLSVSSSGINVSLHNLDLWEKFPAPIEMLVTKKVGRKMFPTLDYIIKGLDDSKMYEVYMHMERVDSSRYTYDGHWKESKLYGDPILPVEIIKHENGGQRGEYWMARPISFEKIRLTNNPELKKKDTVCVPAMHKWRPVLTIKSLDGSFSEEFRLEVTQFITVTTYQSLKTIEMKVATNKFASRFRSKHHLSTNSDDSFTYSAKKRNSPDNYPTPPPSANPAQSETDAYVQPSTSLPIPNFFGQYQQIGEQTTPLNFGASGNFMNNAGRSDFGPEIPFTMDPYQTMWNYNWMGQMGQMGQMSQIIQPIGSSSYQQVNNMSQMPMYNYMATSNGTMTPMNNMEQMGTMRHTSFMGPAFGQMHQNNSVGYSNFSQMGINTTLGFGSAIPAMSNLNTAPPSGNLNTVFSENKNHKQ